MINKYNLGDVVYTKVMFRAADNYDITMEAVVSGTVAAIRAIDTDVTPIECEYDIDCSDHKYLTVHQDQIVTDIEYTVH